MFMKIVNMYLTIPSVPFRTCYRSIRIFFTSFVIRRSVPDPSTQRILTETRSRYDDASTIRSVGVTLPMKSKRRRGPGEQGHSKRILPKTHTHKRNKHTPVPSKATGTFHSGICSGRGRLKGPPEAFAGGQYNVRL
jgi:hypothetical protein